MSVPVDRVALDDPRWFRVLLGGALESTAVLPRPRRLGDVGRAVHDALWSSGVLLGTGPSESQIITRTEGEAAYVQLARLELHQLTALIRGAYRGPVDWVRVRWHIGALSAAFAGEYGASALFDEALRGDGTLSTSEEERLLDVIGAQLHRRAYLVGNPQDGLPLHAGLAAFNARALMRLAAGQIYRGGVLRPRADAYRDRLSSLKALFVELLAGIFAASEGSAAAPTDWVRVGSRQLRSLPMRTEDRRAALEGLRAPRSAAALLALVPAPTRELLVEQVVLAALVAHRWSPEARGAFCDAATRAGVSARLLESIEARAAAFLIANSRAALALSQPEHESALDGVLQRTTDSFNDTAEAIAREIRETGELGVLLARLTRGETLTGEDRHKMRERLIDLAKVVPSLAIFAAPGGMLLLPIILKLLPFDLRPSAFQPRSHGTSPPPVRKPGAGEAA